MSRYIDADALKETIVSNVYPVADVFNSRDYGMFWTGGIEKAIDEQPTADVRENVMGEWFPDMIYDGEDEWCFVECSNCKYRTDKHYNFCPNCGVDMRGDNNGKRNDS